VARTEGIQVAFLPGHAMRRIANLHEDEAKTDTRDAALIVEAASGMPPVLRALPRADEVRAELTLQCGFDDGLASQITPASNPTGAARADSSGPGAGARLAPRLAEGLATEIHQGTRRTERVRAGDSSRGPRSAQACAAVDGAQASA